MKNGFNASAAARSVGYSVISAATHGSRLLRNDQIIRRVAELREDIDNDLILSAEEVLAEASKLASFDPAELFDEDGRLIPIHELDNVVTSNINEVEMETHEVNGEVRQVPVKVKAGRDKKFGMELLAKYHNLLEKHQQAGAMHIIMDEKDAEA